MDSTIVYGVKEKISKKFFYSKQRDTIRFVDYNEDGRYLKGVMDSLGRYIGENMIYRSNNSLELMREYFVINNEQYLNQSKHYGEDGKILTDKGNYFEFNVPKKHLNLNEEIKIEVKMKKPIFSIKSRFYLVLYLGNNLKEKNFSNLKKSECDTIYSLGEKGIVYKGRSLNNICWFYYSSKEKGNLYLKGKIVEEYQGKTRSLYFNKHFYISSPQMLRK